MSHDTLSKYKVILLCANPNASDARFTYGYIFHIYFSNSNSWTIGERFVCPSDFLDYMSKEYLNGVLYILEDYGWPSNLSEARQRRLALDLEKWSVEGLQVHNYKYHFHCVRYYYNDNKHYHDDDELSLKGCCCRTLVVCNGNLLLVTKETNVYPLWTLHVH